MLPNLVSHSCGLNVTWLPHRLEPLVPSCHHLGALLIPLGGGVLQGQLVVGLGVVLTAPFPLHSFILVQCDRMASCPVTMPSQCLLSFLPYHGGMILFHITPE